MAEKLVIVGASHAAAELITTLRKKKFQGEIVLIGDEPLLPYQRPPLSKKYFTDEVSVDQLFIRPPASYESAAVTQMLSRTAESIDRENKVVLLDDGGSVAYDKLVIATGTRARQLQADGIESVQACYLRTKQDVDTIKAALKGKHRLLVIGAGYIGLEVAASAVSSGIEVTVLEAMDRVLERVTGVDVSDFYQSLHRRRGIDLRLSTVLQEFGSDDDGAYALLPSGEQIGFDCVVVGIGVVPNVELAEAAGLECDNGIVVNEFCQTGDPDIYAIGDCTNHHSPLYGRRMRLESVPNAVGQAKTAAVSICGENQAYDEVPWFWSDQYDVKLQTAGLCQGHDEAVIRGDVEQSKFAVFYLRDQRLIAVDAINSPAEFMVSKKLIAAKAIPDAELLADPEVPIKFLLSQD